MNFLFEEVADAIGGAPLRIAVWVGLGLTAGLGVGSRPKETHRGVPNPIDVAIQNYDFDLAERMIRQTFPVWQQAEVLAKLQRIKEEIGQHLEEVARWNKRIGELVAAGDYDDAAAFVKSLNIDSAQRKRILGQIRETEKRNKALAEWDRKITAFVASGQFDKAISFVNKLDLSSSPREAIVTRLREMKREAEKAAKRPRDIEEWNSKIKLLASGGQFDQAIAFAGKIDIDPDERDQVIAQLRALKRKVLGGTWALEIDRLLAEGHFRQAIAFADEIDVEPEQHERLISAIEAAEQRAKQRIDELRRAAESSRRHHVTPVPTAAPKVSDGGQRQGRAHSKATPQTLSRKHSGRASPVAPPPSRTGVWRVLKENV